MRRSFCLLVPLLWSALAWADGPSDLRASLRRLGDESPVKAEVACMVQEARRTLWRPMVQTRAWRFQLQEGGTDLRVDWPRQAGPDPCGVEAWFSPGSSNMDQGGLEPRVLEALLHPARDLTLLLETSRFQSEVRDTLGTRPVRVLTFIHEPWVASQHRGWITRSEATFRIWMEDDGRPLALETFQDYEGRHSRLCGRIHSRSQIKTNYALLGRRLVVSGRTSEELLYDGGDLTKRTTELSLAPRG